MSKRMIPLSDKELNEVINCVEGALREGIAYGMASRSEQALLEFNRRRLLRKLERLVR